MSKSDEWYTPKYIFDALDCEFDMDVAHPKNHEHTHVPAKRFIYEDSLNTEWFGFVWMNAPYGNRGEKDAWMDKMFLHYNGIALTPDRTSAPWWQKAAMQADAILFVHGKIKFIKPDGTLGNSPENGTTLMAYGSKAVAALTKAKYNHLGTMLKHS